MSSVLVPRGLSAVQIQAGGLFGFASFFWLLFLVGGFIVFCNIFNTDIPGKIGTPGPVVLDTESF
jgi:hypothetical protein